MLLKALCNRSSMDRLRPVARRNGFSLIELLTVIFIISLLIAILIPSLTSARNAAKKTSSKATLNAIKVALESFRNDNEKDFRSTNGYPPSFAHPPIDGGLTVRDAIDGQFPFLGTVGNRPKVYGAHWLPAMLIGVDAQGYVSRSTVPASPPDLRKKPELWYKPASNGKLLDRSPLYLDPGGLRMVKTKDLPGFRNQAMFPDWGDDAGTPGENTMRQLPVVVDAFGQAVLYYAANSFGRPTNMIECVRKENNDYGESGPPYYFHQDNIGFTGDAENNKKGWSFGGSNEHWMARCGNDVTAVDIEEKHEGKTFARLILDRNAFGAVPVESRTATTPMKPINPDSYLLLSPGVDGLYGTRDDVNNFPTFDAE